MNAKPPLIRVFTSKQCPHCHAAKQWLKQQGLRFEEWNVETQPRARKLFQQLGGRGVPLITVGDKTLNGFDPKTLSQWLKLSNKKPNRR